MTDDPHGYHRKVSRLPGLAKPLDPVAQELFETYTARGSGILNLHRTSCHAPELQRAKRQITMVLRNECQSTRLIREMVIMRTANLINCAYELNQHEFMAKRAGMSDAQIEAVAGDWRQKKDLFTADQQAMLAYLDQLLLNKGDVDDETFNNLAAHFSPREIVEITQMATAYLGTGLF
ncbi:MAG: hypothetical protein RLZ98_3514, partial [Pseudomonadota bacterium]